MNKRKDLLAKRAKIIASLTDYPNAISGNFYTTAIPRGSKNYYGRLTWKEKKKTKICYVRKEEIAQVRKGVVAFSLLKAKIQEIGDINRRMVLPQRNDS